MPVECFHCNEPLGIHRWDYWNGFLVVCPHCGGFHGRRWGFERTLMAGLFFNAIGFFLVFRPRNAATAVVAFAGVCGLLAWALSLNEKNDAAMIALIGTIVLGPVLINAGALIWHQVHLDRAPPEYPGT